MIDTLAFALVVVIIGGLVVFGKWPDDTPPKPSPGRRRVNYKHLKVIK